MNKLGEKNTECPKPPIVLAAEAGWSEIEIPSSMGAGSSFVSGEPEGNRLRIRYFQRKHDRALVGKVWFGPGSEGPPGYAHGGSIASVLDEVMGGASWLTGHIVLAARLTTEFRQMLPLGTIATLEAWVEKVAGRKVITRGRILRSDGTLFAEGEGLFIKVSEEKLGDLADHAKELIEIMSGQPDVGGPDE